MWLNLSAPDSTDARACPQRFFAVGEEKTILKFPPGYGYAYKATDHWLLDYMLHNLTPNRAQVWITYDIDFIPATSPAAKNIVAARPIWMDVQNGETYPVFNVPQGRRARTASTPTPTTRRTRTSAGPRRTCGPSTRTAR